MKYVINGIEYNVLISKKNNKNTYIRIKNNIIYVTTNYFVSNDYIQKLLNRNYNILKKMLEREEKKSERSNNFYFYSNY